MKTIADVFSPHGKWERGFRLENGLIGGSVTQTATFRSREDYCYLLNDIRTEGE